VEIVEFGALTDSQRAELEGDEEDPFDARGTQLSSRAKDQHIGALDPDGRLVASAGLVLAEIQIDDGAPTPVVGLGGVIVAAHHRGRAWPIG
jgi:GNAT acetyltransferase-like protein